MSPQKTHISKTTKRSQPAKSYKILEFMVKFGDPDWIRTNNLPLRRGLLYPVEPRDHVLSLPRFTEMVNGTDTFLELPLGQVGVEWLSID
jgi:hypothetical protein